MVLVLRDHYTQVNYVFQRVIIDRVIGVARQFDYFISSTCINQVVQLNLTTSPKHKRFKPFYLMYRWVILG